MEIRPAVFDDVPAVSQLYAQLFADMARLQPESLKPAEQDKYFLDAMIEMEEAEILVAEEAGQVLGFAVVQARPTPPFPFFHPQTFADFVDVAVAPAHRGKGIGKALIAAVGDWAKERGLAYVELTVLAQNQRAIRLYEELGFTDASRTMRWKP